MPTAMRGWTSARLGRQLAFALAAAASPGLLSACASDPVAALNGGDGGVLGQDLSATNTGDAAAPGQPTPDLAMRPAQGAVDPNGDGPYKYAELDDKTKVAATSDTVAIHCAYPTSGPSAGPYPVVIFGHGMQLAPSQYTSYLKRLASFGYVALSVDFPASLFSVNNPQQAKDMLGGIDWAGSAAALGGKADVTKVGMSGHSLGGKVALLAASMDPRVKAAFVLDPVDAGGPTGCTAPNCVTVKALMPGLHIPTGFIGETTDAMGGFQPCAPAADNFTTFYAGTNSPSLEVTALGANHMSFLDDVAGCGLTCSFCNKATAPAAQVSGMAHAFQVAFYERWLRGDPAYDTYLTGADADSRYVATKQATITSK